MSSITIHDIDDELNERLTREARRRNTSKNALIKRMLAQEMGLSVDGAYADDYREFVGLWSSEEHAEFSRLQRENRTIDPADWT
ncbi:MAG TPA: CopG family transcriptional regulator [Alkalispirochaeta sp.]|nr:CopG family transcriptional regulator [Alkalispirochaeta sp.]